jgi:hypothetical protein
MGGPSFLRSILRGGDEEILLMGPEDLEFQNSWDWMMPVWKKLRKDLMASESDGAMLFALSRALDEVDLATFHRIVVSYCVQWCARKQIKL